MIARRSAGEPAAVVEVELTTGDVRSPNVMRPVSGYRQVWALALRDGVPIGDALLKLADPSKGWEKAVLAATRRRFASAASEPVVLDRGPQPLASVIIATSRRQALLRGAVGSILRGRYANVEVIVVDNSPGRETEPTVEAMREADARVSYLWEPVPGISRARNAGAGKARGEVLAFTDDDVIVSEAWIASLVATLGCHPAAACTTGLIAPAELETAPQRWTWAASGLNKGYSKRVFDRNASDLPALFPFRLGIYGSGANLAIRASAYHELGGFDEALGTGTPARGGEDLDLFLRLMLDGRQLVYQPAAYLFHHDHRRFDEALAQRGGYGVGLAAVLTKHLMTENATTLIRFAPGGLNYMLSPRSPKNAGRSAGYPRLLDLAELVGVARGPRAYWRSRKVAARVQLPHRPAEAVA